MANFEHVNIDWVNMSHTNEINKMLQFLPLVSLFKVDIFSKNYPVVSKVQ